MKKRTILFVASFAISLHAIAQFAYGFQWANYPPTFRVSKGFYSNQPKENFCLGYVTSVAPSGFFWWNNVNFWIQAPGGQVQGAYYIYDGQPGCGAILNQVMNGSGMSAVESNFHTGYRFALAGTYDQGCYFLTINGQGNPVSKMLYPWPSPITPGTTAKPIIVEDSGQNYYICGPYNNSIFLLKVNSLGSIIWSKFYSNGGILDPKDILVNPYNPSNLIIAGRFTNHAPDDNGFIMEINGATGNVIAAKKYGVGNSNEYFNKVIEGAYFSIQNPQGFVIGGYNQAIAVNSPTKSWVLKLDQNLNLIWSKVIQSTTDINATEIVDIVQRQNTFNNTEYYALAQSSLSGMLVYKLDVDGSPFPISTPNALNNEFFYSIGGSVTTPVSISADNSPTINEGLHIFGSADNTSPFISRFYTHAYFNGENCNVSSSTSSYTNVIALQQSMNAIESPGMASCGNFNVLFVSGHTGSNLFCNNYSNAGSNQRMSENHTAIPADPAPVNNSERFLIEPKVYPNPASENVVIELPTETGDLVQLDLFNILGEHVATLSYEKSGQAERNHIVAELNNLEIKNGIYLLRIRINQLIKEVKIVIQKSQ